MVGPLVCAACALVLLAGRLPAFEVQATVKKVDADRGVVVFTAGQQAHTAKVPGDVKVLDADGKDRRGRPARAGGGAGGGETP
jgi:hypothetical protein